jgi:hypothetical protein
MKLFNCLDKKETTFKRGVGLRTVVLEEHEIR